MTAPFFEVKEVISILEKVLICLDLEPFLLELSNGRRELDACHSLIGRLGGALLLQLFRSVVMTSDTHSAAVTIPSHPRHAAFNPY